MSVVIPCHNSLRWLPETLASVEAQIYADYEVVLIDDGGDDDLAGWVASRPGSSTRVVRQENAGVAAARNRGVREAEGELIAFLDSDDLWVPRTLAALVEAFDAARAAGGEAPRDGLPSPTEWGMAYGWHDVIDSDGHTNGRMVTSTVSGDVWDAFVSNSVVGVGAALIDRRAFEAVGGFAVNRERFAVDVEDWELWIRIAAVYRVAVAPELVLHVRRHESNSTGAGATDTLHAAYRAMFDRVFAPTALPSRDEETLRRLREAAVSRAEIILMWHSLNDDGDRRAARAYLRSARRHRPDLWRVPEYWRARVSLLASATGGGYQAARAASHVVRRATTALRLRRRQVAPPLPAADPRT